MISKFIWLAPKWIRLNLFRLKSIFWLFVVFHTGSLILESPNINRFPAHTWYNRFIFHMRLTSLRLISSYICLIYESLQLFWNFFRTSLIINGFSIYHGQFVVNIADPQWITSSTLFLVKKSISVYRYNKSRNFPRNCKI